MTGFERRVARLRAHVLANEDKAAEAEALAKAQEQQQRASEGAGEQLTPLDKLLKEGEPIDLETLTVKELREIAKENDISGYSDMKKDELIVALKG